MSIKDESIVAFKAGAHYAVQARFQADMYSSAAVLFNVQSIEGAAKEWYKNEYEVFRDKKDD